MSKTIYISAGHSNADPGAVNAALNLHEADLTRALRNLVVEALESMKIPVQSDGRGMENKERNTAIAEAAKCDGWKIDIHFNAATNPLAQGVECFSDPKDRTVAQEIASSIAPILSTSLRGAAGWKGRTESQHGSSGLAWLDRLEKSILIEVCFISNREEIQRYLAAQGRVANAIADVLRRNM